MKVISFTEIINLPEREKRVVYDAKSKGFDLFHKDGRDAGYFIEAKRIETDKELIHWIRHLSQKLWVDTDLIEDLIDCVYTHLGKKPHGLH